MVRILPAVSYHTDPTQLNLRHSPQPSLPIPPTSSFLSLSLFFTPHGPSSTPPTPPSPIPSSPLPPIIHPSHPSSIPSSTIIHHHLSHHPPIIHPSSTIMHPPSSCIHHHHASHHPCTPPPSPGMSFWVSYWAVWFWRTRGIILFTNSSTINAYTSTSTRCENVCIHQLVLIHW